MNILLIVPSDRTVYEKLTPPEHPHLGIGYIAAVLESEAHTVQIVDMDADGIDEEGLSRLVRASVPSVIGITATTPQIDNALALASRLKKCVQAPIVLGGIHATLMPLECAADPSVDFVVVGEGERTIVELVRSLEQGGDPSGIAGLAFRQQGKPVQTGARPPIEDLDSLPFPARHLFKNHTYTFPDALRHPAFPIITSRGCPGNCTFCTAKYLHGRKFRCRSAENVLDEIEMLIERYGAREIHIWDDNFITNRPRVFAFRDGIRRRKIETSLSFPNGVRADFITSEVLQALKDCGAYSMGIGVESGNQAVLNGIQKGLKLEQIEKAFLLAKEAGIETWGFFLLGLPGDDAGTIAETIEFAVKLDPGIAKFHILKPFPRSAVHEQLKAQGLIVDEPYIHYGIHSRPVHRLPTMTQDDLLAWQKKAYRRFYLRPSKMAKEIMRIRSWNRLRHNVATGLSLIRNKMF